MLIGKNISVKVVLYGCVYRKAWGTDAPKIFLLRDAKGNIYTIRSHMGYRNNQKWLLTGKVKRINSFNNQKQIHISDWSLANEV